jgi:hypothetical protein
MSLSSQNFPYVYYKEKILAFGRSKQTRFSYFGGPAKHVMSGVEHGIYPLHHVLTIWNRDLNIEGYGFGFEVPLFYGLCYDGCSLEYKRTATRVIEITRLSPTSSSDDWPYPNYPAHLPYVPLEIIESRQCSLNEFSDSVMQGIKSVKANELVAVVPPNPELGMSIWGVDGDAEDVQIIFRYDVDTGITQAYSACT